jgi:hypothetical protein
MKIIASPATRDRNTGSTSPASLFLLQVQSHFSASRVSDRVLRRVLPRILCILCYTEIEFVQVTNTWRDRRRRCGGDHHALVLQGCGTPVKALIIGVSILEQYGVLTCTVEIILHTLRYNHTTHYLVLGEFI